MSSCRKASWYISLQCWIYLLVSTAVRRWLVSYFHFIIISSISADDTPQVCNMPSAATYRHMLFNEFISHIHWFVAGYVGLPKSDMIYIVTVLDLPVGVYCTWLVSYFHFIIVSTISADDTAPVCDMPSAATCSNVLFSGFISHIHLFVAGYVGMPKGVMIYIVTVLDLPVGEYCG